MSTKLLSVSVIVFLFALSGPAAGQDGAPWTLDVSEVEAVDGGSFRLRYAKDGVLDSVDVPQIVLLQIVRQFERARATSLTAPPTAVSRGSATETTRKRGFTSTRSAVTGQDYTTEIILDSLVTIQYQEAGVEKVFKLPIDVLGLLYEHHQRLSGRMVTETQMYIEPETGTFWVTMARGFNYKVVLFVLSIGLAALVFVAVYLSTRHIRKERDELKMSGRRMLRIREAERSHLASELHDGPVQDVQRILRSNLSSLAQVIPTNDTDDLTELEATLRQVAGSLRDICTDLKPPVLAHFGLEKAAESCVRAFQLRNSDTNVVQEFSLGPDELPEEARLVAYRILQEALNNVEKHANAKNVRIGLTRRGDEVQLIVADDGRGFRFTPRFSKFEENGHFGLSGMRQRVDSVGGMLYVDSAVGKGTRITVLIPAMVSEGLDLSTASSIM